MSNDDELFLRNAVLSLPFVKPTTFVLLVCVIGLGGCAPAPQRPGKLRFAPPHELSEKAELPATARQQLLPPVLLDARGFYEHQGGSRARPLSRFDALTFSTAAARW